MKTNQHDRLFAPDVFAMYNLSPWFILIAMSKIYFLCFLLFSASGWALTYEQFVVKITNSIETDCLLKDSFILFGHVSDHTSIPTVIHAHQTETFMMRAGPRYRTGMYMDKSFLLTYVCGIEQEITLYTSANNTVEAKKFDVKSMSATFERYLPMFGRAEIHWTLSY